MSEGAPWSDGNIKFRSFPQKGTFLRYNCILRFVNSDNGCITEIP